MPLRLSESALQTITNKDITTYYDIVINGICYTSYIKDFNWQNDSQFSIKNATIKIENENGQFSNTFNKGDSVLIIEGLYNSSNILESFNKFKGQIFQISPESTGIDEIQLTCVDNLTVLQDTDVDDLFESGYCYIQSMPLQSTGGVKLEESKIIATCTQNGPTVSSGSCYIYVDDANGFEPGTATINIITYNTDGLIDTTITKIFTIVSVDLINNQLKVSNITPVNSISSGDIIRQSNSQMSNTLNFGQFFDFGYWSTTNYQGNNGISRYFNDVNGNPTLKYWFNSVNFVSPKLIPIINIHDVGNLIEDPQFNGFTIGYEVGQLQINSMLNIVQFEVWSYFHYYELPFFIEDVIEQILLLKDNYKNNVFVSSQILNQKMTEDGNAIDVLYPNVEEVEIENVIYEPYNIFYHKYNNIQSNLLKSDYQISDGSIIQNYPSAVSPGVFDGSLNSVCQRYGCVIVSGANKNTIITYNYSNNPSKDYTFKTLQSSGVKLSVIDYRFQNSKIRYDAIKELCNLVAPNYVIYYDGYDKVWLKYLQQRSNDASNPNNYDYELPLIQSHTEFQDADIYTRVRMLGHNSMPNNLLPNKLDSTNPYQNNSNYTAFASQQKLVLAPADYSSMINSLTGLPNYYYLKVDNLNTSTCNLQSILTVPQYPKLWINNQSQGTTTTLVDNYPAEGWTYITNTNSNGNGVSYIGFAFIPETNFNLPFNFYIGSMLFISTDPNSEAYDPITDSYLKTVLTTNNSNEYFSGTTGMWEVNFINSMPGSKWGSESVKSITSIDFSVSINNVWKFQPKNNNDIGAPYEVFKVDSKYVQLSTPSPLYLLSCTTYYNGLYTPGSLINGWTTWLFDRDTKTPANCISYAGTSSNSYFILDCTLSDITTVQSISFFVPQTVLYLGRITGDFTFKFFDSNNNLIGYESYPLDIIINGQIYDHYTVQFNLRSGVKRIQIYINSIPINTISPSRYVWTFTGISEIEVNYTKLVQNISADFWYTSTLSIPSNTNISKLTDGSIESQCQTVFSTPPVKDFIYIIFNLVTKQDGSLYNIDAIDITGGFYIPNPSTPARKYSVSANYTLLYSLESSIDDPNNTSFYPISSDTSNFSLTSNQTVSFEQSQLGANFEARRIAIQVNNVSVLSGFGNDIWVVSLAEFDCYSDLILDETVKLVPQSGINSNISIGDTIINGTCFTSFLQDGTTGTAVIFDSINGNENISYSAITNSTMTLYAPYAQKNHNTLNTKIVKELIDDNNPLSETYGYIYDSQNLLANYKDKVYRNMEVSTYLNTVKKLKNMANLYLNEYISKTFELDLNEISHPDANVGDTVLVENPVTEIQSLYYVSSVSSNNGQYSFKLAKYL